MAKRNSFIIGLDIGTTKVCAVVGEILPDGRVDIVGIGNRPSKGLRKGVIINIDNTVRAIQDACKEAQHMSGVNIDTVVASIAGDHIRGFNSRGVIAVSRKNREITRKDMYRAIDAARAVAIPADHEVLHVLPQEYLIDNHDGIKDPVGMKGVRMEVDAHIVTSASSSKDNIMKCIKKAGFDVSGITLEQLASSEAALSQDEKELGVALLDIGGGTTDVAIYVEGHIWHSYVLPLGGNNITNDIAVGLKTPYAEAEKIKKRYGYAMMDMVTEEDMIKVPARGNRKNRYVSRKILAEIIEPRVEEIFKLVKENIENAGYADLISSGVVLTGGTSLMEGITEFGEEIFGIPFRRGEPMEIGGLVDVVNNPSYSTGVGLILYSIRNGHNYLEHNHSEESFMKKFLRFLSDRF
ncbi:cell division protein FtsA [candidate division CSSED10-310 bacterium]|uniref:Cell division protein FtsA n=1 Tax=candidate division CSSED10-310 bacterium TaxID=2855610 RepID=A0ABV6YUZ2_UNCC1